MAVLPYPFPYFAAFQASPTLPNLYWNVYSEEQRWKDLCLTLGKLIAFNDAIVDTINDQYRIIEELKDSIGEYTKEYLEEALEAGELDPQIIAALAKIKSGESYNDIKNNGFAYKEV